MTLKSYIWGLRGINLISLSVLVLVIYFVDPEAGVLGLIIFYLVLFFALSGVFNLILLTLRNLFLGHERALLSVSLSFRQGILLGALGTALLFLQSFRLLFWWDAFLVAFGIFLVELYFLSKVEEE